jgi:hypothetical protein
MYTLIVTIAEQIPVDLFSDEIQEILESGYEDLDEIFVKSKRDKVMKWRWSESGNQMRIRLDPSKLAGLEYRFQLDPGSTAKKTKEEQLQSMLDFLNFVGKIPNALQQYQQMTGRVPNWDYIFKQFGVLADIPGMDKMFITMQELAKSQPGAATDTTTPPAPAVPGATTAPAGEYQFNDPALAAEAQALKERFKPAQAAPQGAVA